MRESQECDTWCDFCGCCEHTDMDPKRECIVAEAPMGMECPGYGCGCEGTYYAAKPKPCDWVEPETTEEKQLHQDLSLF